MLHTSNNKYIYLCYKIENILWKNIKFNKLRNDKIDHVFYLFYKLKRIVFSRQIY